MTRTSWAVLVTLGLSMSVPVQAYDPPASTETGQDGEAERMIRDQEAEVADWQTTRAPPPAEARPGAGSMEPAAEEETDEERVERDFVANVWNSP